MTLVSTTIDPVTFEVISHRLWSINEEGATTIVHASGSPVVHATDYNFGIYTPKGELAVSGVFYMIPIFVMQRVIGEILASWKDDIHDGDVFVVNDPFIAGIHQSDVQFVSPFFHDGELVAWTGCMAHLLDVGGMYPGSWCPGATDVYQEGLLIPPARIMSGGVLNQGLWDVIVRNSRLAPMVANDMSAFLSAHRVAQTRMTEMCAEYGAKSVSQTMSQMLDRTERQMRAWITELPDGRYQHVIHLDHDGIENAIYKIDMTLIKDGDRLIFDFEGTSDVIIGIGNSTESATFGSVGAAILGVFGGDLAWNGGLMRAVEVRTPSNSMVSAQAPAPISAGSTGAAYLIECAGLVCLGKVLAFSEKYQDYVCGPADGSWLLSQMGGRNQFGETYATMNMDPLGWGGPAFRFRDGVDVGGSMFVPGGGFNDVELTESTQPLLYLWRRENADSGGGGRMRGGNGIEVSMALYDVDEPTAFTGATMGMVVPSTIGFFGAYPGATGVYEHVEGADWRTQLAAGRRLDAIDQIGGEHILLEAKCTARMQPEDVMNHVTQSAGGFGDPLEREPSRVLHDVLEHHVTAAAAREVYGVVIKANAIDVEATAARVQEILAARLASLENRQSTYRVDTTLPVALQWGEAISLVLDNDQILVRATKSGTILGPLGENWRDVAPWRIVDPAELGPGRTVDPRLEVRQYVDPTTGRSLWVDVNLAGDVVPIDFLLAPAILASLRNNTEEA